MRSFKDLIVWQKAMDLTAEIYRLAEGFPHAEAWGLTSQIRRAAASVPANIAEGHGRYSTSIEFARHLGIAQGSLAETETFLLLAIRLRYLTDVDAATPMSLIEEVGKMLRALRYRVEDRAKPHASRNGNRRSLVPDP